MNRMIALVLIVVGATLLVFGYDASKSFGSEVTKAFTGEMSDRAQMFLIGGGALVAAGIGMIAFGRKKA